MSTLLRRGCLSLLLLAAAGEIGVRAVEAFRGGTGSLYDGIVAAGKGPRFKMRPGGVTVPERYGDIDYRFNEEGYRDGEPRPGARRIVLLGDSVSFGLGVDQDEIYPFLLEKRLNAPDAGDHGGRPWDVINLAIFAYNTADELAALKEDGLKHRPELVLLQFYMNDFAISAPGGVAPPPPSLLDRLSALKNRLVYKSALYRRLHQAGTGLAFAVLHDARRNRWAHTLNDGEPRGKTAYLTATPDDGAVAAFRSIREIHRLARENGGRLAVILSPDEVQLFTDRFDGINRRFAAFCRREGIELIDPLPVLRAAPDRASLFNDGVHYSPEGHALLARVVAEDLARRGLLP